MRKSRNSTCFVLSAVCLCLGIAESSYSMGLRSFVALPVEKDGSVIRLALEHSTDSDINILRSSMAYGFNTRQTLLLGVPYRLSPSGGNRQGDVSVLYRHITWQKDTFSGTDRFGLLGGAIVPTEKDREEAFQGGFVFTHFKNRHEIDIDSLYQAGIKSRKDSGRYDVSWQYRLLPTERSTWGIPQEINSVLEINGRWLEGNELTHQITTGLQWIHQKVVLEGGITKDINNENETRYLLSTRFHF